MPKGKQKSPLNSSYAKFSGIAFQMFAIIAIGAFLGVKLDEYLDNNNNLFTIIFSLVAVLLAIYSVIRQIIKMGNEEKE